MEALMTLLTFILLGILQGFTEPLPISSSGHLLVMRDFFGMETSGLSFEIIVHLGSLIAIIFIYQGDIKRLIKESFLFVKNRDKTYVYSFKFSMLLLLSTCITGVIGLTLENFISDTLIKPLFVGIAFLITSFFIWKIRHLHGHKTEQHITVKDAIIIGLAQAFALIPGISRSGATIVAAMFLGMKRLTALRFSFLLFIPIGLGVNVLSIKQLVQDPRIHALAIPYFLAFLTACIATYIALKLFIRIMERGYLTVFSLYCFVLGCVVISLQFL